MSLGGGPPISRRRAGLNAYIPAFTRSEAGRTGFSVKPVIQPAALVSSTPPAEGSGEWNAVRVATAPPWRWAHTRDRRSKSVRLSALQARKKLWPPTQSWWAASVPALPSSSGSANSRTAGGPLRPAT